MTGAIGDERFPVYGKLHGDYHSDALKNTTDELRDQDAEMRQNAHPSLPIKWPRRCRLQRPR